MKALSVRAVGRVLAQPLQGKWPRGATSFIHQWPGVYFEAAFEGSEVLLKFDDPLNEYRLLIDDAPPITIRAPGKSEARVSGLSTGEHRLRLEKVSESRSSRAAFQGFYIRPSARPLTVRPRERQIEFIGDSAMAGYGNRSTERRCTPEEVRRTTDTQSAFPALVAKRFDADYQVNAISSSGLIRNYGGTAPERALSRTYPFMFLDKGPRYFDRSWKPQLVVLKLQADFVGEFKPQEKWQNAAALSRDYAPAYGRFITRLHRRYPSASFLIWWFDRSGTPDLATRMMLDEMAQTITSAARASGVQQLHFLPISDRGLARTACAYHYSLDDHESLADVFADVIQKLPQRWSRKKAS